MWEARVAPGRLDAALAWVADEIVAAARAAGVGSYELCSSTGPDERIVLVTRWPAGVGFAEPDPPAGLLLRAQAWVFELVTAFPGPGSDPD